MNKTVIATFVAIAAGPAMAGSLYVPPAEVIAQPVTTSYDWSGGYLGGSAGALFGTMDYTPGGSWTIGAALTYGGFAGYNVQNGAFVYGGELSANMYDGYPTGFPTESFSYILDAKARAGYAMDDVLVYGFAGGSLSHYNEVTNWPLYGANFGAGVEFGLFDHVTVGGEYIGRYLTGSTTAPGQSNTDWLHGAQARVALRF